MPLGLSQRDGAIGLDVELVSFAARRHRVECLLYPWLFSQAVPHQPEAVAVLKRARQQNAGRALAFEVVTDEVHALCGDDMPSMLVFKGSSLARQLYGDPLLRRSHDVDLLVHKGDFLPAARRLLSSGFVLTDTARSDHRAVESAYYRMARDIELHHAATGIRVELHQRRFMVDRLPPFSTVQANAPSLPTPALDAAYATYLIGHGAQTDWHRMKWLADLTQLWRRLPEAEFAEIIRHCERSSMSVAARASLRIAEEIFPKSTPPGLLEWAAGRHNETQTRAAHLRFRRALYSENGWRNFPSWTAFSRNPYDSRRLRGATLAAEMAHAVLRRFRRIL